MAYIAQDWTMSGLSVELGMDRRTLGKKLADVKPSRIDGKTKFFRMADVVRAVFSHGSTGSLEGERIRLTKEQADKTEIENKQLRGELAPIDDMGAAWLAMTSAFRSGVLSMPSKLAPLLAAETDRQKVKGILELEIKESLNELSTHRFKVAVNGSAGDCTVPDEPGNGKRKATAKAQGQRVGGKGKAPKPGVKRRARKVA